MSEKQTLLVVDDDPIAREGLGVILRREGYEVILTANGEEALAMLRRQRPDLILLDMLMPILDGWHFLERLKTESPPPAVPILVVTATILTREWAADHGCAGCIRKPIDPAKLLDEIRRCLQEGTPGR
jgi:CheY-like chemotaxis protein